MSAEAIVIGAQGHGPLEHLLFGSNALHVVRRASCPVFIVRPLKATTRSGDARSGSVAPTAPGSGGEPMGRRHPPA